MLKGKVILNTRAREQASELSRLLEAKGAEVVNLPCLQIEACRFAEDLSQYLALAGSETCLLFTSSNAVRIVAEKIQLSDFRIACIGKKTAKAVSDTGAKVEFTASNSNSEGFARELLQYLGDQARSTSILLLRGDVASRHLSRVLGENCRGVKELVVYKSVLPDLNKQERESLKELFAESQSSMPDAMVFSSSLAIKNFAALLQQSNISFDPNLQSIPLVVVGPKTAASAAEFGFEKVIVAKEPSMDSIVRALVELFSS